MYTTGHIYYVLPIEVLINQDGEPTTPHEISTGKKPSVSNPRVLFCPCVVQNSTSHVETNALNMCHQPQKGFRGIFILIPQHKKSASSTYLLHGKIFFT